MVRKFIVLALLLFPLIMVAEAQSTKAAQVIDKARIQYEKCGGVTADFDITMTQKGKTVGSSAGSLKMKGRKFSFSTDEVLMWYDGKNQWVMNVGNDEVSLSEPTTEEMDALNPSVLFSTYQKEYVTRYVGVKTISNKALETVELMPKKSQTDIVKITLQIEQKSSIPVIIHIQTKTGSTQKITIKNYKSGVVLADNLFVFNKKQYPKAEVIDLR